MLKSLSLVASGALVVATLAACPPKPAEEPLPPSGLAGTKPGTTGAGLALPGAGEPVEDPSGTANLGSTLPPGHPPIPGAASADAPAGGNLPAGHPDVNGPPQQAGALPASLTGADKVAAVQGGAEPQLTGQVLETMDVPEYTYMRIKTATGEEWAAVNKTPVAVGDTVTVSQSLVMENFPSKSLGRTFPRLVMGTMVGAPKKP
jgi:hypothetical protein